MSAFDPQASVIPNNFHRTLLEMRLDAESGALRDTVVLDVPTSNIPDSDNLELDGGQKLFAPSRFLYIRSQSLVFDTRTRVFYEFLEFFIARVRRG